MAFVAVVAFGGGMFVGIIAGVWLAMSCIENKIL